MTIDFRLRDFYELCPDVGKVCQLHVELVMKSEEGKNCKKDFTSVFKTLKTETTIWPLKTIKSFSDFSGSYGMSHTVYSIRYTESYGGERKIPNH